MLFRSCLCHGRPSSVQSIADCCEPSRLHIASWALRCSVHWLSCSDSINLDTQDFPHRRRRSFRGQGTEGPKIQSLLRGRDLLPWFARASLSVSVGPCSSMPTTLSLSMPSLKPRLRAPIEPWLGPLCAYTTLNSATFSKKRNVSGCILSALTVHRRRGAWSHNCR